MGCLLRSSAVVLVEQLPEPAMAAMRWQRLRGLLERGAPHQAQTAVPVVKARHMELGRAVTALQVVQGAEV